MLGCIVPAGHGWQVSLDEAAEADDHVPAGQAAQYDRDSSAQVPGGQGVQPAEPRVEKVPAGQAAHSTEDGPLAYVPAEHATHSSPSSDRDEPAGQGAQAELSQSNISPAPHAPAETCTEAPLSFASSLPLDGVEMRNRTDAFVATEATTRGAAAWSIRPCAAAEMPDARVAPVALSTISAVTVGRSPPSTQTTTSTCVSRGGVPPSHSASRHSQRKP
jgi:hypothetical protein